jgi:hypothetical protein
MTGAPAATHRERAPDDEGAVIEERPIYQLKFWHRALAFARRASPPQSCAVVVQHKSTCGNKKVKCA